MPIKYLQMSQKQKWFYSDQKEKVWTSILKLNGKQLDETNSVKYLGIRIGSKLNWKVHIDNIALNLIRANAMLYKVRDYVNAGILKAIYHTLFESRIMHVLYGETMHTQSIVFLYFKRKL